jgi:ABC-type polysaccharide/polyol phosphate export permease
MTTVSEAPHADRRLLPSLAGLGPTVLLRRLASNRFLLRQLVRKGVLTTYQGSMKGVVWIVLRPLLTVMIYGFGV